MAQRVVSTFCATRGLYRNLSCLHIKHLFIDAAVRDTLGSPSRLEDLTLFKCTVVARQRFLRLKRIAIMSGWKPRGSEGPLQITSPVSLRALAVDLSSEVRPLITRFGPEPLPHLVHLSIAVVDKAAVGTVFHFLEQCPQLQSPEIWRFNDQPTLPAVRPTTVPRLRTLTRPPKLMQLLVPNRPVSGVTVLIERTKITSEDLIPACMNISRRAPPIRPPSLPCLAPLSELLAPILRLFPDLSELTITVVDYKFRLICGGAFGRQRRARAVDSRTVQVCDADAVDDPTVEDISDAESDSESDADHHQFHGMHDIVRSLVGAVVLLPPRIEILRVEARDPVLVLSLDERCVTQPSISSPAAGSVWGPLQ
ncbi:hypothetical protein DFH09DRAFT_1360422 [Mycena vulgaris]|nr:hypothetical protein DFH09DRAFT_1360422 [Mycena vulgaris]